MIERYIIRYVSGASEEIESDVPRPDNFDGSWRVWLLDYRPNPNKPITDRARDQPVRIAQQVVNMETVEKVQEMVET